MPLSYPLTNGIIDPGITLNANGAEYLGAQAVPSSLFPQGIAGHLEPSIAPDGSPAMLGRIASADLQTYGKIRSEIVADQGVALVGTDTERWYVWEMFVPVEWSVGGAIVLQQIHDDPDAGETPIKAPNFVLYCSNTELIAKVPLNTPDESFTTDRIFGTVTLIKGRWVKCAVHAKWETTNAGFLDFIYDGRIVGREWFRPSHFPDLRRPYLKLGPYNSSNNPAYISDTYLWYRNVVIWGGKTSPQTALGAPISPRLMRANNQ